MSMSIQYCIINLYKTALHITVVYTHTVLYWYVYSFFTVLYSSFISKFCNAGTRIPDAAQRVLKLLLKRKTAGSKTTARAKAR